MSLTQRHLLGIPLELREAIYEYALLPSNKYPSALLPTRLNLVCRQFRSETKRIYATAWVRSQVSSHFWEAWNSGAWDLEVPIANNALIGTAYFFKHVSQESILEQQNVSLRFDDERMGTHCTKWLNVHRVKGSALKVRAYKQREDVLLGVYETLTLLHDYAPNECRDIARGVLREISLYRAQMADENWWFQAQEFSKRDSLPKRARRHKRGGARDALS